MFEVGDLIINRLESYHPKRIFTIHEISEIQLLVFTEDIEGIRALMISYAKHATALDVMGSICLK